jgi:hypothetical protein
MRTGEECSLKMDAVLENTDEKLSDFGFGIVVDVSLYSNCGVFRRYHVSNNPTNAVDPEGKGLWDCIKALDSCNDKCKKKVDECRKLHANPSACFERGETEIGDSHLLKECYDKIPECQECVGNLLECGYIPIHFPRITR